MTAAYNGDLAPKRRAQGQTAPKLVVAKQVSSADVQWLGDSGGSRMNAGSAIVAPPPAALLSVPLAVANGIGGQLVQVRRPGVLDLAATEATYFRTPEGEAFARIPVYEGGVSVGTEVCSIHSERFDAWLTVLEARSEGGELSAQKRAGIVTRLKACALLGPEQVVHLRVAKVEDGVYYIDMGDKAGRAFKVNADGWETVKNGDYNDCGHRF
jgi:hypothetical protein